ncbi:MAG: nickel insertion protein, partial [Planctomycetota bacterium]
TTLTESFGPPARFAAQSLGYGAGARDPETGPPTLLRVQLGTETTEPGGRVEAWLLEVNLDDMSPEEVGHAVGALREAGALEVWCTAAQMKKDRPGAVVSALTRESGRGSLERVVFELTTTLGVRWTRLERTECARREIRVQVAGHPVRVKVRTRLPGPDVAPAGERDLSPEHDDLVAAAKAAGLALREARRRAIEAALDSLAE